MTTFPLQPVKSSNIAAVGSDGDDLLVKFHDGKVWRYHEAGKHMSAMLKATSVGGFFRSKILPVFGSSQIIEKATDMVTTKVTCPTCGATPANAKPCLAPLGGCMHFQDGEVPGSAHDEPRMNEGEGPAPTEKAFIDADEQEPSSLGDRRCALELAVGSSLKDASTVDIVKRAEGFARFLAGGSGGGRD